MTNKEAISILRESDIIENQNDVETGEPTEQKIALDMAIEALCVLTEYKKVFENIRGDLKQSIQNGVIKLECGNEKLFVIIDCNDPSKADVAKSTTTEPVGNPDKLEAYQKSFEDIRAEIKELDAYNCKEGAWYLDKALSVIDKHDPSKAEKEQDESVKQEEIDTENMFVCRAKNNEYCLKWYMACRGWENCSQEAPCPLCENSTPLVNDKCVACTHYSWKQTNYREAD